MRTDTGLSAIIPQGRAIRQISKNVGARRAAHAPEKCAGRPAWHMCANADDDVRVFARVDGHDWAGIRECHQKAGRDGAIVTDIIDRSDERFP
jgi:hypothetical protein